jgi:hypothetical protein
LIRKVSVPFEAIVLLFYDKGETTLPWSCHWQKGLHYIVRQGGQSPTKPHDVFIF